jgi:DNA-directed RNA polymerase subunit RPC12/RpoP
MEKLEKCPRCGAKLEQISRTRIECTICNTTIAIGTRISDYIGGAFVAGLSVGALVTILFYLSRLVR